MQFTMKEVLISLISGAIGAIITVVFTWFLARRETKINHRAFLITDQKQLDIDGHPAATEDKKIIKVEGYAKLLQAHLQYRTREKLTFLEIKNMGPGAAVAAKVDVRIIFDNSDDETDGWRLDNVHLPILEKGDVILIPILNNKSPERAFYLSNVEIEYRTLVNEKMKYCLEFNRKHLVATTSTFYKAFGWDFKLYKTNGKTSSWFIIQAKSR